MSSEATITQEVRTLALLDLEGLRAEWRRRYGPPPKLRSPDLLRHMLAWRIQSDALGGLDGETRRLLRRPIPTATRGLVAATGARLVREWKGVPHEVDVVEDGFAHEGRIYRSLSEVARAITGARWNGPRFFGLRKDQPA